MTSRLITWVAILIVAVGAFSCGGPPKDIEVIDLTSAPGEGFMPLFNGTDFTGWDIGVDDPGEGAWRIEDGIIHCLGEPRTPYLITTDRSYGNYDFYTDFMVTPECNSGIFHHVPSAGRQSFIGFETQILDDRGKPTDPNSSGSIYDVLTPLHSAMKRPGEWNQYRVRIEWPSVKVWLNGTLVQDADFSTHPRLKYRMLEGPFGLSNHGSEAWFRNMWVKDLPPSGELEELFNGVDLTGWTTVGDADWHVEDGMIVSSAGDGWLLSESEFDRFCLYAYADCDTLQQRSGAFHYRWKSPEQPGYRVDFYDYLDALEFTKQYGNKIPPDVISPIKSGWFLYRIASGDRRSLAWLNEFPIVDNRLLGDDPRGRIAVHRTAADGVLRLKGIQIRRLPGPGI